VLAADAPSTAIASETVLRFSALGVASVGTLVITGVFNSFIIVGSLAAFVGTDYGRLLLLKIALFVAMLSLAAINRFQLTPAIAKEHTPRGLRRIRTDAFVEATIGLLIVAIVGLLGTMSPGE
jgi:putative copper resistance protein D